MTRHEASPWVTVKDDSQLHGMPIVLAGAGPYGGDLEVEEPLVTGGKIPTINGYINLHR